MADSAPRAVPKLLVLATAAAAILVLLASGARTWVTGKVSDPVLAQTAVSVDGSDAASGVVATALVAAAAALAAVTGGRIVRWIGAIALALSGVLTAALTLPVLLDAAAVVGREAATKTGRTGSVEATGEPGAWVYLSLLAAAMLILAGCAALQGVRRWGGLTSKYDAPTGPRSVREDESAWDRLSRGEDPT